MLADLRYAWRQLKKSPGFALTAVLTLALGIGANTAIYSIIHGSLRLPYPNADRMVGIQDVYPQGSYYAVSYPDFLEWRDKAHSFAQLVARSDSLATWVPSGVGKTEPEAVDIGLVSNGFFRMFGMQPIIGRDFIPSEHQKGGPPACVLAEGFWRQQLSANPGVVGRTLNLDGKPCTIVGVVPVFRQPQTLPAQIWLPLEPNRPSDEHGTNYLFADGLLRPGTTEAQALAELTGIQAQIDRQFPGNKHGIAVHPLAQAIFGDLHSLMLVLLAAVGFILLIACVNLANMLLARASGRSREFAVRRALGATALRMVRQTLTESLLLSFAGAAAGLVVAFALMHIPIAAWPKRPRASLRRPPRCQCARVHYAAWHLHRNSVWSLTCASHGSPAPDIRAAAWPQHDGFARPQPHPRGAGDRGDRAFHAVGGRSSERGELFHRVAARRLRSQSCKRNGYVRRAVVRALCESGTISAGSTTSSAIGYRPCRVSWRWVAASTFRSRPTTPPATSNMKASPMARPTAIHSQRNTTSPPAFSQRLTRPSSRAVTLPTRTRPVRQQLSSSIAGWYENSGRGRTPSGST